MFNFLSLKENAFGLDFSDKSIKVAHLKRQDGGFKAVALERVKLDKGVIEDGVIENKEKLVNSIRELTKDLDTNKVMVALPEEKAFLQIIQMPKMEENELKTAVRFEVEDYIPIAKEKLYVDHEVVASVVDSLDHLDVMISALPREIVDTYLGLMRSAGLDPVVFEMEPQSITRSIFRGEVSDKRTLIIGFGATRTRFIVHAGYSVRFFSSSLVCNQTFDQAISKELGVSLKEAEEIKCKFGLSKEAEIKGEKVNLFDILTPSLTDLSEQIKRFLDYYLSHTTHEHLPVQEKDIDRIILTGGGAALEGLDDFIEEVMGVGVERADPLEGIETEREVENPFFYTTVIGLALRHE